MPEESWPRENCKFPTTIFFLIFYFSIGSGKIVNHTVMTEYHEHSRILQANFRNMTLRDKGRGDRRGTESVAEEKFSIVFQVPFLSSFEVNPFIWDRPTSPSCHRVDID